MKRAWLAVVLALLGLALLQGSAMGAFSDEEELWRSPSMGSGAVSAVLGVGSDPVTGHLYVFEQENNRVSEFTPWGNFIKAFGWDVAPGAVNEQQEVRVRAAGGQFKLSFGASTTGDLPVHASGSELEAALNGLPSISGGGGSVSVTAVEGTPDGKTPFVYAVVFKGALAGSDVAQLGAQAGTTPPSGGVPAGELLVRTRADGTSGGAGLESCTEESGCKAGIAGGEPGQFGVFGRNGVVVDSNGNVYVSEVLRNNRVQKFDAAGNLILVFGGKGAGPGQFEDSEAEGMMLCPPARALCPDGALFVADKDRIQRFDLDGNYKSELPVPGNTVQAVAFDPVSEDLYATYAGPGGVHKLDSLTGAEIGPVLKGQGMLATDLAGNVFVRDNGNGPVLQYSPTGSPLSPPSCCLGDPDSTLSSIGTNGAGNLHVAYYSGEDSFIRTLGPPPVIFEGPPQVPPQIAAQFASSVERDSATVAAQINPRFFTNTRYYVQYGTGECAEGGCPLEKPVPPGAQLTSKTINVPLRTAGITLEGLVPATTYHYRFIAESGGGGPVYGVDPDGEGPEKPSPEDGLDATFITPDQIAPKPCPNDVFRGGGAARLPNCRAYELVSPIDKNNGDIKTLLNIFGYPTSVVESAPDGGRLTYSSYRAFANPKGAPYTNQLLATRDATTWGSSEAIDPPQGPAQATKLSVSLGANFKDFSDDLCLGWVVVAAEPQLDPPRDTPDYANVYRRENCGPDKESYEALIPVKPTITQESFYPEPQGASADGGAAIFRINDKLTPDAALGPWQAYYARGGELKLLCVLPSGSPSGGNCSGGTGAEDSTVEVELGRLSNVANAISDDGSRVYWTDSTAQASGAGKVYLRINPGAEQSTGGACEAGKACTVRVSEPSTTRDSRFLLATPDGSRALFEVAAGPAKGDFYEFNLGSPARRIAGDVLGLAGASEDLSRIYFVSEEALASEAVAEEPNLYLEENEEVTFIATLSRTDTASAPGAESRVPAVTARKPLYHAAQASADGSALAFISSAKLSDYDNTDLASGEADSEVYVYEIGSGGPVCVSCNPSRARPQGGRRIKVFLSDEGSGLPAAAMLPLPTTMLHFPRAISSEGGRLFFNSFDALLPRDTNGAADVYMWQSAADKAACGSLGAELYVAAAGGCISLISSGESPEDSEFADASVDGTDAFFITNSSLLSQDPGLFDVYDARAGGGLPPPAVPVPDCQGETCKPPATAPNDPTPASSAYVGPGDLNEKATKKKSKKKAKGKKKGKKKKKQSHKGRAAR
jgi:hypothetical protein